MQKVMIALVGMVLVISGIGYAAYDAGICYPKHHTSVRQVAAVQGKQLYLVEDDGEKRSFSIRGVQIPSSVPGYADSDYKIKKKTWLRWFGQIREMGANTIMVPNIYHDTFYDAFYEFNQNSKEPLYLLQGIQVTDYANNCIKDAYGKDYYGRLLRDGKWAADVIHGRKHILLNKGCGSGRYRKDVSRWVLGYVVGASSLYPGTIAYTDKGKQHDQAYSGRYFSTKEGASNMEALLAKVMDEIISYETDKYGVQRLISFLNDPETDPFSYAPSYAMQLGKYVCLDAEQIQAETGKFQGYFAAYQLYEYCPDFVKYFSDSWKKKLAAMKKQVDTGNYVKDYTKLLTSYHSIPVVTVSAGVSTARGVEKVADSGKKSKNALPGICNESQQGEELVRLYRGIVASGCAGAVLSSWQDSWNRITWNTAYSVELNHVGQWHDRQSVTQNYGIMAMEPGKTKSLCYVDGNTAEWSHAKPIAGQDGMKLYVQYDAESVYFLVKGDKVTPSSSLVIPIDTLSGQGSRADALHRVSFTSPAEFLICINGQQDGELLVQERYDSMRQNFLEGINGKDPFETYPAKDSEVFVPVNMVFRSQKPVSENATEEQKRRRSYLRTWETGRLRCGNGNPYLKNYDSLADYCFGRDCVEIRIPWSLLNFSSPTEGKIHDDYYLYYGRKDRKILAFYAGVACSLNGTKVELNKVPLRGWETPVSYHERLKQSYYQIQKEWRKAACR